MELKKQTKISVISTENKLLVARDMGWEVDKMAEGGQKVPNSSYNLNTISSFQSQSCLTLCDPTDCTRLPHPSSTPGACSNSSPLSQWRHPTISSSVIPFSSCLQSFPASGTYPVSQFFTSGESIGASASASVLPMNIQDRFPLGLTGLFSLQSKGLSRVFSITTAKYSKGM